MFLLFFSLFQLTLLDPCLNPKEQWRFGTGAGAGYMDRFHNWHIIISCIPKSNIGTKRLQSKELLLRVP